jgi:hypothetical protein
LKTAWKRLRRGSECALDRRLERIETRCSGGRRVAAILRKIKQADDEELCWMLKNGQLETMANRLSDSQLVKLIGELKLVMEKAQ